MAKFFIADTHFGHANIASKNISKWEDGYRDYNSLEEMNQDMVKWINKTVGPDDELYHLGDWSFGGIENIWNFRKQIQCKNIHLILGNHDEHIEKNSILPNVTINELVTIGITNFHSLQVRARDLFSSVQHYKEVMIGKTPFILFHYGMRVWHGSHKGWVHLYGHSHDTLPSLGKSMDVGVDSAIRIFGVPMPFSSEYILKVMANNDISFLDHHDSKTTTGKIKR